VVGGYDWRATEAELNSLGSVRTSAAGQQVHLLHVRSDAADAIPLVLTHGWPGSIIEFLDAIPLLRKHFHVVAVSMPGTSPPSNSRSCSPPTWRPSPTPCAVSKSSRSALAA
jgi:pimeloyl-ACP methyl ester carboxylesterase